MTNDIPGDKSAAVTRAVREAFGTPDFRIIAEHTQGFSKALVYRIEVREKDYLLRVIMRADSPAHHYANMRAAATAGLAPHVWYTNDEDKVSITDFIHAAPFSRLDALAMLPGLLRNLHALPPFPPTPHHINTTPMFLMHEGPALEGFRRKFQDSGVLPANETSELLAIHEQLFALYPHGAHGFVSSHCDLKPENIVFDGQRPWLVDWEAAFLNDPWCDLAVMANFIVRSDVEDAAWLAACIGSEPQEYEQARYYLMQQIVHLFYAMAWIWLGSRGEPIAMNDPIPDFTAFHEQLWAREIDLENKAAKVLYGHVHREQLRENLLNPRWNHVRSILTSVT